MLRQRSLERPAALALAIVGWATITAQACGPSFPNSVLESPDRALRAGMRLSFLEELKRVGPAAPARYRAIPPKRDPAVQTANVALEDLKEALKGSPGSHQEHEAVAGQYARVRAAIKDYSRAVRRWRSYRDYRPEKPRPRPPDLTPPRGLPDEFSRYLKSALAYHRGELEDARAGWLALLELPSRKRHYRSTWATFMIGKTLLAEQPAQAIQWFRRVRTSADQGFADSLGLAASSIGWEGQAELRQGHYGRAIELYLVQLATDDPTAVPSLLAVARRALDDQPQTLRKLAANTAARRVITARLVCADRDWSDRARQKSRLKRAAAWLAAIEAAGISPVEGADRLALAAYNAGEFDTARRWIDRAPPNSVLREWIRAKLFLHAGELNRAAELLGRVVRRFPRNPQADSQPDRATLTDMDRNDRRILRKAAAELGILRLARRQYAQALHVLLQAGRWLDAAYVAERVLSTGELISFVDRNFPGNDYHPPNDIWYRHEEKDIAPGWRTRYLLARRLTRENRGRKAREYYPENLRPRLDQYLDALTTGNDARRPADVRAAALWRAARLARWYGMALMGTELDPDWFLFGGDLTTDSPADLRRPGKSGELAPSTDDERGRVAGHVPKPNTRFHYRYVAADHAWAAAELMPDHTDQTAEVLCTAGRWLMNRDPRAADRFYKALVNRCRWTKLGREADRLRWFPKMTDDARRDDPRR